MRLILNIWRYSTNCSPTQWGMETVGSFLQTTFSNAVYKRNILYFYSNFTEVCQGSRALLQYWSRKGTDNRPLSEPVLADHRDGLSNSIFFSLILDSPVGLSAGIQSAGDLVSETLWVRILHSAEEDSLSPFDSNIACLCQSIKIKNNKHIQINKYVWICYLASVD